MDIINSLVTVLLLCCPLTGALFIDGCPSFGCRPSGSFSFYLNLRKENASINWVNGFLKQPVPNAFGCVADSSSIVCPSNGVFSDEKGYVSLYVTNGTVRWRDRVLQNPSLPILDNYGDVTGSDGSSLVHYDMDGTKYPVIPCEGLQPIFSMQLVGTTFLLLVSEKGGIVIRETNGIPVGELILSGSVQRDNGTFLPISQPVVNGKRFYVLTEFVPEADIGLSVNIFNLQRLYAIDVHDSITNRITVAWSFDFEMETDSGSYQQQAIPAYSRKTHLNFLKENNLVANQNLLWSEQKKTVYVILPAPYALKSSIEPTFWALEDLVENVKLSFRSALSLNHMTSFESDHNEKDKLLPEVDPILWVSTDTANVLSIVANGSVARTLDLNEILKISVTITTKMSVIRNNDSDRDILVFGIKCQEPQTKGFQKILSQTFRMTKTSNETSFVVAIDTSSKPAIPLWLVPTPGDMVAKGQIVGSSGEDIRMKDQLVVYAENGEKSSAEIFSIH